MVPWPAISNRLHTYPSGTHRLLPPCPEDRLRDVQLELGELPDDLVEMLRCFNGGRLFEKGIQLVALFGVSTIPPLPPLEWSEEWRIDKFTPRWRAFKGQPTDWAIGMMNYGGLIILRKDGVVGEWDTSQRRWEPDSWTFAEWIEKIIDEGEAYINES